MNKQLECSISTCVCVCVCVCVFCMCECVCVCVWGEGVELNAPFHRLVKQKLNCLCITLLVYFFGAPHILFSCPVIKSVANLRDIFT